MHCFAVMCGICNIFATKWDSRRKALTSKKIHFNLGWKEVNMLLFQTAPAALTTVDLYLNVFFLAETLPVWLNIECIENI